MIIQRPDQSLHGATHSEISIFHYGVVRHGYRAGKRVLGMETYMWGTSGRFSDWCRVYQRRKEVNLQPGMRRDDPCVRRLALGWDFGSDAMSVSRVLFGLCLFKFIETTFISVDICALGKEL